VVVDVTESPMNRLKKGQKVYYSGKKQHTLKTQVMERNSLKIIDVQEANGSELLAGDVVVIGLHCE
jgi:hypothetical protein